MNPIWRKALIAAALIVVSGLGLPVLGQQAAGLQEKAGPGVLSIVAFNKDKTEIGRGSAVVLSPKTAVTSYHLVSPAASVVGLNYKKKEVDIDGIIAVDKSLDLVLLQISGKATPLPPAAASKIATGQKIFGLGANESGDLTVSDGAVRTVYDLGGGIRVADSTLAVPDSFSGAAVLDEGGSLLGMIVVLERRLRFIVPVQSLLALPATAKMTPFKAWAPEDYLASVESAWLGGRLFAWADDPFNAQRNLEKVTKAQPNNLEAWVLLSSVLDKQRDYANAITAYRKVVELDPRNAAAHLGLGQILVKMQKPQEAAPILEKALELDPAKTEALLFLGQAYQDAREFPKAAEAYRKYIATGPANVWTAYQSLGTCLKEAGQFDQAAAAFAEALKAQPNDTRLANDLAQSLEKAGQLDRAEEIYKKLADASPKDAPYYYQAILTMYDRGGQPAKAVEAAAKLVELNPKSDSFLTNLGIMQQKMKKDVEAIETFKKTVAVNPTSEYAWFQMGVSYYNLKNYKDAAASFGKAAEVKPDNAYAWLYIGICQMQLKGFEKALDPMKRAVDLQPENTDALFNLGVIYLNLKDRFSAQEIVKKLQGLDAAKAAKLKSFIK